MIGNEALEMNGTWSVASGELIDYWHYVSGSTEFTALTVALSNGNEVQSMFWNSAVPAVELAQFEQMVGEEYSIYGVVTFYQGTPQLTCGYMEDIVEFVDLSLVDLIPCISDAFVSFSLGRFLILLPSPETLSSFDDFPL